MMLLLDIGNSRIKWGLSTDGSHVQPQGTVEHEGRPAERLGGLQPPAVDAVWVSQVLGAEQEPALADAIQAECGVAPGFARTLPEHEGLRIAYAEPERLGVDRWLAMLGLWTERQQAFGLVNAGTALTFDAVDDVGQHLGGLIAPGLRTAEKAVLAHTRFAVRPQPAGYTAGLGRDTESCVRQGAFHACAGLIERARRLSAGAGFIAGGDAETLLPSLGKGWEWRPNVVLEGLLAFARAAKK